MIERRGSARALTFLAVLLALPALAAAQQWTAPLPTDKVENGVNWTTHVITATGVGVPRPDAVSPAQGRALAIVAARVAAQTALLEMARGVAIDAQRTVVNAMASEEIRARVTGVIRGAQVVQIKELGDGAVEVTMAVPATGEFADLMLPRPPAGAPRPVPPAPFTPTPSPTPAAPRPPDILYTGLVIDARGLGVKPAMAPKIVSEAGQEVYGSAVVDRKWAIEQGMAGYSKELPAAQSHHRVADRPVTVKALGAAGANRTDVIISNADAQVLLGSGANLGFLEKARVMLVVD